MSNFSTVDATKVGFSEGARVLVGPVGATKNQCTPVGLLGADATLNINLTYRKKEDHFPQVEVASALQSAEVLGSLVLREWKRRNLQLAFDVPDSEVTDVPGSVENVTEEAHTIVNRSATLRFPGASNISITKATVPMVEDTDYTVTVVDGRTVIVAIVGSALDNDDEIEVDYEYTPLVSTEMPIGRSGPRNYYTVIIEEKFTMSATAGADFVIHKAAIGLDGSLSINSAEDGADLPVVVNGVLDVGQASLAKLVNYE